MHPRRSTLIYIAFLLVLVTLLQTALASGYSLWGDELDNIAPALRPWTGEKSFWWQIRQYNANPPGDPWVLRGLLQVGGFDWLKKFHEEIFWRAPYILVYSLTGFFTYLMSLRWSKSDAFAFLLFCAFLLTPGTFTYATENRFYIWGLMFMTLSTWEVMIAAQTGFALVNLVAISIFTAAGVCFHIALALNCYLFFWFGLFFAGKHLLVRYLRGKSRGALREWVYPALVLALCCFPYLLFKHEKHHWIFLPGGKGMGAVFWDSLRQAPSFLPQLISSSLPFARLWNSPGLTLLFLALPAKLVFDIYRKNKPGIYQGIFLSSLLIGGSFLILISANANNYPLAERNLLFEIPVIYASLAYLFFSDLRPEIISNQLRPWLAKIPGLPYGYRWVPLLGTTLLFGYTAAAITRTASERALTSPAKSNFALAKFRDFYRQLPDSRKLVVVGADDGTHYAGTDRGVYIGGAHLHYTREFNPIYITERGAPAPVLAEMRKKWNHYEFLILGDRRYYEKAFTQLPWNDFKCTPFIVGEMNFCRTSQSLGH